MIASRVLKKIAPPPKLTVSQWADSYRKLSSESSAEPGNWRTSKAPYQREIMDAVNDPQVEMIVIMSSAQVGKTEIINNIVGYHIHQDPAPMLVVQPTEKLAESWSTDRLTPMLRDSEIFKQLIKDPRSRDSGNKILYKRFPGGHITMAGSNSPSSLASRPVRIVLCDEVDRYPASAGSEGDPVNLTKKRATTFWNRKIILTSTPTIKDASRIELAYLESDQRRYYVPCKSCGEYQTLKWAQVKWPAGQPELAHYVCEVNGCVLYDGDKYWMLAQGYWQAENKANVGDSSGIIGFHLSELYSPWVSWPKMASEFLRAKTLPETLKTWINTSLGETWEEGGDRVDEHSLFARKENWGDSAPSGVLIITAGVDVQNDRLELEIVGWGVKEESWSLDYRIIYGDPALNEIWEELDDILEQGIKHASGVTMRIAGVCVDSGGNHTQSVYSYCKKRQLRRVFAVKGASVSGKALVSRPSVANKLRVKLFSLGTDTAKEMIYSRLKVANPGPGYCHFPVKYDEEYFKQLTIERIVTRYNRGFPVRRWEKPAGMDVRLFDPNHPNASFAEFEKEASTAVAKKIGREPSSFFVPLDVSLEQRSMTIERRGLEKLSNIAGGYLVDTDYLSNNFIELLRNKMLVKQMGARVMSGLHGDVAIPKQSGGANTFWVSEGKSPQHSQPSFAQVTLSPKSVAAYTDFTRKLVLQSSPDIENLVRNDLATVIALEIDRAAINGNGQGAEPAGILKTKGISEVKFDDHHPINWGKIVDLESLIAAKNADIGNLGYLCNAAMRGLLKQKEKADHTAQFIWEGNGAEPGFGYLNGYRVGTTNQMPADTLLFGNFGDLIIGQWGVLDVLVDPYTLGTSGGIRIRVMQDVDIAVRHSESFAVLKK